jgi:hypothetical protein
MTTQKELLEKHREGLDEAFVKQYPNGKFCLQYRLLSRDGKDTPWWGLHWCPKRSTSHVRKRGISTESWYCGGLNRDQILSGDWKNIQQENYQNCSFGRTNNYDSLDKLLIACERKGCPKDLVEAFVERYKVRAEEWPRGFKI